MPPIIRSIPTLTTDMGMVTAIRAMATDTVPVIQLLVMGTPATSPPLSSALCGVRKVGSLSAEMIAQCQMRLRVQALDRLQSCGTSTVGL